MFPRSKIIILLVLSGILVAALSVSQPLIISKIIDNLLQGNLNITPLLLLIATVLAILIFEGISKTGEQRYIETLRNSWRHRIFSSFSPKENGNLNTPDGGTVLSQLNNDIEEVINSYYLARLKLIIAIGAVALAALGLTTISPIFLASIALSALLMLTIPLIFRNSISERRQTSLKNTAQWNEENQRFFKAYTGIRRRGALIPRIRAIEALSTQATRSQRSAGIHESMVDLSVGSILFLNQLLIILLGWWLVTHDHISVGQLVAALQFEEILLYPLLSISDSITDMAGGRRIGKGILQPDATHHENDTKVLASLEREHHKTFLHCPAVDIAAGPKRLKSTALDLEVGKAYTLSGPSGYGKSRYLTTLSGDALGITIPGLAYIPAEEPQFSTNFSEEVSYGLPIDRDRVTELIRGLDSSQARLAHMFHTNDCSGASLGERQRISLLRCILTQPSFIILDEALSHLEQKSAEKIIGWLLEDLGLGLIVVSHSPLDYPCAGHLHLNQQGALEASFQH